jgi:hypothetical protein
VKAEKMGDVRPDRMQWLLYSAAWDADAARDELQRFVMQVFGDEDGIGVVDKAGFPKSCWLGILRPTPPRWLTSPTPQKGLRC